MDRFKIPPMSPELNPIENVWHELKSAFMEKQLANFQEVQPTVEEEWEKIPSEQCQKLKDSYKKCLEAVAAAKVGSTRYSGGVPLLLPHSFLSFLLEIITLVENQCTIFLLYYFRSSIKKKKKVINLDNVLLFLKGSYLLKTMTRCQ